MDILDQERYGKTPIERIDLQLARHDIGVIAFGFVALAALVVSMPETYKVMERYHNSAIAVGFIQSVAALIVFELGAIISKLATLWFPEWKGWLNFLNILLIGFVFAANCVATYSYREELGAIGFAAMMPIFQLLFTWMTVARIKAVHIARLKATENREPTQAERLQAALAEQQEKAFKAMLEQVTQQMTIATVQPAALPAPKMIGFAAASAPKLQAVMPQTDDQPAERATDEVATRNTPKIYTCKKCGQAGFTFQELGQHSRKCKS